MKKFFSVIAVASLSFVAFASFSEAEAKFKKATYVGKPGGCADGEFWDPRNGGECWSCSKGMRRTAYAVDSAKACVKPAYTKFRKAKKKRKNKHVGQGCPKGQFWDVKGGNGLLGACYTCSGYNRTARAVTHKKACSKRVGEKLHKASYKRKWACKAGTFYDPRKGGECWSCSKGWYRTVNPVTNAKACTNKPLDILAADTSAMCKSVLSGLDKGTEELEKLEKRINALVAPVKKPLEEQMKKLVGKVKSPRQLNEMLERLADKAKPFKPVLDEVARFHKQINGKEKKLKSILLDGDLMCGGNSKKIIAALKAGGFKPNMKFKKASIFDGLIVKSAHASTGHKTWVGLSFGMVATKPTAAGGTTMTFTVLTDFEHRVIGYMSSGIALVTKPGLGFSIGAMLYPYSREQDFDGFGTLGVALNIELGNRVAMLLDTLPASAVSGLYLGLVKGKAAFTVNIDPTFASAPGFGREWGFGASRPSDTGGLSLSSDISVRLF